MSENDKKYLPPLKAIRQKCLDCCCWSPSEVAQCTAVKCPLHVYRFGKKPESMRRKMSDEQRAANIERLRKMREARGNKNEQPSVE